MHQTLNQTPDLDKTLIQIQNLIQIQSCMDSSSFWGVMAVFPEETQTKGRVGLFCIEGKRPME